MRKAKTLDNEARARYPGGDRPDADLLDPLDRLYKESGLPRPSVEQIDGDQVPEPYRNLLVHPRDLTPTLESAYDDRIHLRVIRRGNSRVAELRQVVLVLDRDETPVAFGAIRIHLNHLPVALRAPIREGRLPFARVLQDFDIIHSSRVGGYFRILSDREIGTALGLSQPRDLFGRRNRLLDGFERPLAEVVEVLPPADIPLRSEA